MTFVLSVDSATVTSIATIITAIAVWLDLAWKINNISPSADAYSDRIGDILQVRLLIRNPLNESIVIKSIHATKPRGILIGDKTHISLQGLCSPDKPTEKSLRMDTIIPPGIHGHGAGNYLYVYCSLPPSAGGAESLRLHVIFQSRRSMRSRLLRVNVSIAVAKHIKTQDMAKQADSNSTTSI